MTADDDIDSEDLALYGDESKQEDSKPKDTSNDDEENDNAMMTDSTAVPSADVAQNTSSKPDAPNTESSANGVSDQGANGIEAHVKNPASEKQSGNAQPAGTAQDGGADVVTALKETGKEDEKEAVKEKNVEQNGGDGDEEKESEDDSDGSSESEEDSDDESVDIVLNDDIAEAPKPQGATLAGSIGKVRLPSNKWQRPGYVPPARETLPAQGLVKAGGVLGMLPTPTMSIRTSQKSVYDLEIGKLTEKPWNDRGADLSDYFNYGFNEETWKLYCERQMQMRLEASSLAKIKTVDGANRPQNGNMNRSAQQVAQKNIQAPQNIPPRPGQNPAMQGRVGNQNKMQPPHMPPGPIPPPPGMPMPPGGIPQMPPGMPFPFPIPNAKGEFQPPFSFMPGMPNQPKPDGKGMNPFFQMPGVPHAGMPMGAGRGGTQGRGFPGQMQRPNMGNGQKDMRSGLGGAQGGHDNHGGRGLKRQHGGMDHDNAGGRNMKRHQGMDHGSRFGSMQGGAGGRGGGRGGGHGPAVHPSRQANLAGQGQHGDDDRRRWGGGRGNDRRHGDGGDRGGYDDRYRDRGHDRRRSGHGGWNDRGGDDRRRGYENPRYDQRRDYERDRDRGDGYRRRGRDYDDDGGRKRQRR